MSNHLIFGNEPYRINKYKKEIKKNILEINIDEINDFGEDEVSLVKQAPFFSSKRIVLLNLEELKKNDTLSNYIKSPSKSTDLYIFAKNVDKRTNLYKSLKDKKEFKKFTAKEFQDNILQFIANNQAKIKTDAYNCFVKRINYNSEDVNFYMVTNWLRRLCDFGTITSDLIEEIVPDFADENIFVLIQFLSKGEYDKLFYEVNLIIENNKNNSIGVLSLLQRSFRLVFKGKVGNYTLKDMGVYYNTPLPLISADSANRCMDIISSYVYGIKSGKYNADDALKICLVRLCQELA